MLPPKDRTLYRLGAVEIDRCPLSLLKGEAVQHALSLFAAHEKGITPNGNLRAETSAYRSFMDTIEGLKSEAENWHRKETEARERRKKRP